MDNPLYGSKRLAAEAMIAKAAGKTRVDRIEAVIWDLDRKLNRSGNSPAGTFAQTESHLLAMYDLLVQLRQQETARQT